LAVDAWARAQSFDELKKRSKHDLFFTQLATTPEKSRGKLFELKLHLRQVLQHEDIGENSAGVKEVYEARGVTEESRSNFYVVIFADKPPQLPDRGPIFTRKPRLKANFLKLWRYEDGGDRRRYAPLLDRTRLIWQEKPRQHRPETPAEGSGYFWPAIGGGTVVLFGDRGRVDL